MKRLPTTLKNSILVNPMNSFGMVPDKLFPYKLRYCSFVTADNDDGRVPTSLLRELMVVVPVN